MKQFLQILFFSVMSALPVFAQSYMTEVTGVVTDFQTREPLIGVTDS